jgi:hypothetical protein
MICRRNHTANFLSLLGLALLTCFFSCGLAYKKQITGKYYIVGVDTDNSASLSYKLASGDYVGKAPGKLLEYGFNDTFMVAKTQEYKKNNPSYFIIDMTKDSELAHEESFRIGPLSEDEFSKRWKRRLNIQLIDIR